MDKIPTQKENNSALEGNEDLNKKIVKLGEMNKLVYEDLILLINFGLVKNGKTEDFP